VGDTEPQLHDVEVPELVGLVDIAAMMGKPLGTVHAWHKRGHPDLPEADTYVAGTPIWIKQRFTDPELPLPELPKLIGLPDVARIFGVQYQTAVMWRMRPSAAAPEPAAKVGKTHVWAIPPWIAWAERTGRPYTIPDDLAAPAGPGPPPG
jgi:hypothetical protein